MQTSKRLLALLLTLCLLLVCLPASALAEEAKAEIVWQQLYLGKNLEMHFYASVPEAHKSTASVSVTVDGQSAASYAVSELETVDGHYDLSVSLAPAQITDSIAITVTSGDETLLSKQYTLLDYLKAILSGNYSDEAKALVKELLNYGAQAQVYFDHHADTLANAGYEVEPSALPTEAPATTVSGSVNGVHFYGASLLFESEIGLRLYFTAPDGIADLTFETSDNLFTPVEKNGLYYVETYFYPQHIGSSCTLTVSRGSGDEAEEMTVSYSPLNYILRMYSKSTNASFQKLLLAANSYFTAAQDYTANIRTGSLNPGYTTEVLVQFNNFYDFGVPADNTALTFTGTVKLDGEVVENPEFIGYANNTTICLNNISHKGKVLTIEAGSVISYEDKCVEIAETFNMVWDGTSWAEPVVVVGSATLTAGWTNDTLVQFTNFYDFGVPADNTALTFTGTVKLDGEVVENPEFIGYANNTTICLNNISHKDKVLTIEAGSTISYSTKAVEISETFNMIWGGDSVGWSEPVVVVGSATLTAGWTNDTLVQFTNFYDFGVPADNTALTFTGTVKLDGEVVENPEFIGYANNTTICLNNISHKDKVLTIEAGSTISYGTKAVEISETFNMIWGGDSVGWKDPNEAYADLTFELRGGEAGYIQVNTNLPASTPCANFLTGDNGSSIDESANLYHQVSWIAMAEVDGTIILTFTFDNITFNSGETYVLPKGAVFGFADGNKYTLDKNYMFTFDGNSWSVIAYDNEIQFQYHYGTDSLIQFKTNLSMAVTPSDFSATSEGFTILESGDQSFWYAHPESGTDPMIITFQFQNAFTVGQRYTLKAGTVFAFSAEAVYTLLEDITLYWDGENWSETEPPKDELDESHYTGGEIITFADRPVDSRDTEAIEKYKALGFNTSLLTEDFATADSYKIIVTTERPEDSLGLTYRWGQTTLLQVNTTLPSDTFCGTIYPDTEGSAIIQSGNHPFSQINVDNADGTIVLSFIFNTAFSAGETYSLASGSIFILPDGSKYELDANYTFTSDGSEWSMESDILTFDLVWVTAAHIIQLKTNIPSNLSCGNFLVADAEKNGHKILLEQSEGSEVVGWCTFLPLTDNNGNITSDTIYFNLNFDKNNEHGAVYTLKAGTTLNAGGKKYVTVQDYTFTITKPYLSSLENLNKAGLDVWIRNYTDVDKYFSDELTAILLKYTDSIKGFYMADEVFETHALLEIAKEKDPDMQAAATDLESMSYLVEWFNTNFADTYFHVNHGPISSYDHYTTDGETPATSADATAENYQQFLETYREYFNEQLEGTAGSSISFDNYPFTHAQGKYTKNAFTGNYESTSLIGTFHSGIAEDYLINALIAANVAGNDYDLGICIQAFEATDLTLTGNKRDITTAEEISFQIYSGLAFGADLFEYFAYTSSESMGVNGILNEDGTERIYQQVLEGNKALSFAEVSNSFDWDGIITVAGTKENYNETAFSKVEDMVLTDTGALSTASATYDAIIGCFSHENGQNGYMVVNYNDPVAVTESNSITVNFGECTRARVYTLVDGELTSEIVELTNGSYTATVAPGSGFFIIPA